MSDFKFNMELVKKLVGECLACAMLNSMGCMIKTGSDCEVLYGIGWGFCYTAAMHTFGFLSGAHLNPAVSGLATIVGVMDWKSMLCYMLVQLIGTLVGFFCAYIANGVHGYGLCVTVPPFDISNLKVLLIELIAMMALLFAYCGAWDPRSNGAYDSMPVRFGLIIGTLLIMTSFWTGGSLNFFRSMIPGLVNSHHSGLWALFVAHLLAVGLVGALWRFVIGEKPQPME